MPTLYGVGVGPGDPELITLKGARVLDTAPVVAVPVAEQGGESYALQIVAARLKPAQRVLKLHFPMVRDLAVRKEKRRQAAEEIAAVLAAGEDVAFLTEGDPLLHSTFSYLLPYLPDGTAVEVVPGVSSVMAAAAEIKTALVSGNQSLVIFPVTGRNLEKLPALLAQFDTVVLLKAYKVLPEIIVLLKEQDLLDKSYLVERASHAESRVLSDLQNLDLDSVHYLSLLIVHAGGNL